MKRFCKTFGLVFVATIIALVSVVFVGCDNDGETRKLKVNEVTHSIFYAPFYAAINLGYFEEYGIEIELTNGGGSDASMTALISGSADVALMGPETNVYVAAGDASNLPVVFGQLTKRDGSLLIGRTAEPNFDWSGLEGKEIIGGRRGGSPAMALQYALEVVNGYTLGTGANQVDLNLDVAFTMVASAFESGTGDYCTMFEPTASQYVAEGKGYIVASVGEECGEVPFTCFSAKQSFVNANQETLKDFLKAVVKAYEYLMDATDEEILTALRPSFSTTSDALIVSATKMYISIDAWVSSPVMQLGAYNRLVATMTNADTLNTQVPFTMVVDNSLATAVMQELAAQKLNES